MYDVAGQKATNLILLLRAIERQRRPTKQIDGFQLSPETITFETWAEMSFKSLDLFL